MLDRTRLYLAFAASLLCLTLPASGQFRPTLNINCTTHPNALAVAAANALSNTLMNISGTCAGPIYVSASGVVLSANGPATINGNGQDAVTINGAQRVTLSGLTITGGGNGVVAETGAQVTLANTTVSANKISGVVALGNSSISTIGGSSQGNAVHGMDIEATSALVVTGRYTVSGNGVFGINVNNGSSITLTGGFLTVTQNTLGIQLGTNASGFLDGQSTLLSNQNLSDGITIVSGSHVVDFGGTIQTISNQIHGISLNSKAGLDLDAGSQVTSSSNAGDGVHLEQESEITIFNNPNFSGNPTTTLLTIEENQKNGISLLTGSKLLDDNFAAIQDDENGGAGILADDGSSISFGQTIPVTGVHTAIQANNPDTLLTFGSRLTFISNDNLGTLHCDATSVIRGTNPYYTCPK